MKKVLFDTSVILAGIVESHPHLSFAQPWVLQATQHHLHSLISTHCLAELYSQLSGFHLGVRSIPAIAEQTINDWVYPTFKVVNLNFSDYKKAIQRVSSRSLRSGAIYDALHVQAALKGKVDALVTLNTKDFERLVDKNELNIINPLYQKPL